MEDHAAGIDCYGKWFAITERIPTYHAVQGMCEGLRTTLPQGLGCLTVLKGKGDGRLCFPAAAV